MKFSEMIKFISFENAINNDNEIKEFTSIEKLQINKNYLEKDLNNLRLAKLYYFARKNLYQALYDLNKIIRLNYDDKNEENLPFYFYLSLFIRDNENIINYSYSIDYIKNINNKSKIINDKYYKIMMSKIVIDLIKNYKGLYEYEYNKEEIEIIKNENKKIINDNILIFNELGIDWKYEDMELIKIDEIYANIIRAFN